MEIITKYKAVDGSEFNTENQCLDYECLIRKVDNIMKDLPPLPKDEGCEFTNGGGYVQHDKICLRKVKINLLEEIKKHINHKWVQQTIDDENVHPSYVSRLIDDCGIRPLSKAWDRFNCIDELAREWGQPYFANNSDKGKQVKIGGV